MATGNVLSDYDAEVLVAQFSGVDRDFSKASGLLNYSFQVSHGQVRLQDGSSYQATDMTGNRTEGTFNKARVNLHYLAPWDSKTDWFINFSGQVGNKNLDSSETFLLGGLGAVRAYPAGETAGDQSVVGQIEYHRRLREGLRAFAFYDHGWIEQHRNVWPGFTGQNQVRLKGLGAGIVWNPAPRFELSLISAAKVGRNPLADPVTGNDSDGRSRRLRLWSFATVRF